MKNRRNIRPTDVMVLEVVTSTLPLEMGSVGLFLDHTNKLRIGPSQGGRYIT